MKKSKATATPLVADIETATPTAEPRAEQLSSFYFDFPDDMPPQVAVAKAQQCLLAAMEMGAVLKSVDVRRVIEQGYEFAINSYGEVIEMLVINANSVLDTVGKGLKNGKAVN